MKVFISSVIRGIEAMRDAAAHAAGNLGHDVKRSEDFTAIDASPQQACLAGVRWADVVILLLGARYGDIQPSGLSATHEEYREAKGSGTVLAFVQSDVDREAKQEEFVSEVRDWSGGRFAGTFTGPQDLMDEVTRALHELEVSRAAGPPDEAEILERVMELVPPDRPGIVMGWESLLLGVAGGPRQQILRPSELEDRALHEQIMQRALFGPLAILDSTKGTVPRLKGSRLLIEQEGAVITLDELGTISAARPARVDAPTSRRPTLPMLIEEDVRAALEKDLLFCGWLLDRIDPTHKITDVVPVCALIGGGVLGWRTRAEHEANPNTYEMGRGGDRVVADLTPASRKRAALSYEAPRLAEDLTVVLRRAVRG